MGIYAQEEAVINHKGTRVNVRNTIVTTAALAPNSPVQNDIWFDTSAEVTKIYDGTTWLTINLDALAKKEDSANKSTDINLSDATNTKFPTELAVKTYVDTELAGAGDDDITAVSFDGTNLTVAEGTTNFSANLSSLEESSDISANTTLINNHIAADNDLSSTNEIQDADEVNIDDIGGNFTSTNVEGALIELAANTDTTIYSDNGTLTGNRAITQNNLDLNFDANTLVISGDDDRVGIGTPAPQSKLHVYENNGTAATANSGSITLEHGDNGGASSLVFKSKQNTGSDYGYIQFSDDGSTNGSSTENALLEIGVQDDATGTFQDDIALMPSGNVGISTRAPSAKLDVNGAARIRTLNTGINTDNVVTTDTNGNLRKLSIKSLETKTTISQNTTTGRVTHNSEDGTTQSVNLVSTNTNNSITVGTDGGAFFNNPIKAYGTLVPATNSYTASGISSASKIGAGRFTFTMATTRTSNNYPIQLTVLDNTGINNVHIYVTAQNTTSFSIAIVDDSGFVGADTYVDKTFHFTILDF